ncbi:hypothetical protein NWP22_15495 [Anabaenopsis tanganyikae CS-531]|uniref:Uncharacterized protein n=2 Tax=Anabaenopsis TaxID=110103 RepID=A0ABT5AUQ6_9CYAN|nr:MULTISPECIES: hypothetical protein [Anabaenopsis]MDB9541054.1 hypothetical protein [Anabaenopsis arnoldii]MDH6093492.1 hypothetical protein [Anabaenopsis arnoldii]MDH6107248.1 hypothetical protein [Anabaenopsis tanganyikae CS-531]
MPFSDIKLAAGGRLVLLATMEGLQGVEHRTMLPREYLVRVEKAISEEAVFEGAA